MNNKKIVVLAADQDFESHLMTTIKSICYHNTNIEFYLFHNEFSREWFDSLNQKLAKIDCKIQDVKVNCSALKQFPTYPHISSETTFYRYFISDVINAEKALYLDIDLVVTGPLDSFFQTNMGDNYIAGCIDYSAYLYSGSSEFNAGVMLINIPVWKQNNVASVALDLSYKHIQDVPSADQSILNMLFENKWLELNHNFNYLTGAEYRCKLLNMEDKILRKENEIPLVIHYNTQNKPWKPVYDLPLREHYWYYHNLEWNEIISKHK